MELARLWLGLIVAVALPMSVALLRQRRLASILFTASYSAYVVLPVLSGWRAVTVWAAALAAGLADPASGRPRRRWPGALRIAALRDVTGEYLRRLGIGVLSWRSALVLVVPLVIAGLVLHGAPGLGAAVGRTTGDTWVIVMSGSAIAVFIGNGLVALAIRPYVEALGNDGEDMGAIVPVGVYLGWIERALVFIFITAGQPEAAALAIAAKSLARLPELQRHQGTDFGQYVIVGTLTSLLVAVITGVAVRVSLGLSPL